MRNHVLAAIVALTGCGGSAVDIADYRSEVRRAYCSHLVECGEIESVDVCVRANTGFSYRIGEVDLRLTASLEAAVDMSKVRYDGESLRHCLDALGSRNCDPTSEDSRAVPDECLSIFSGTLHADEGCALDDECISRSCEVPACDMACCTGVCVGDDPPVRAQLDDSCEVAACGNGLFCDKGTNTCVALKSQGGFCVSIAECKFGLYCNQAGECTGNLPALGEACSGPCRDEGTQCSTASRTCVEVGLAGAPCAMTSDCSPFYICDESKRCSAGIALGAECAPSQRCADDGAFCDVPADEITGTCERPHADGEPCLSDVACQSGLCDLLAHQCVGEPVCI